MITKKIHVPKRDVDRTLEEIPHRLRICGKVPIMVSEMDIFACDEENKNDGCHKTEKDSDKIRCLFYPGWHFAQRTEKI